MTTPEQTMTGGLRALELDARAHLLDEDIRRVTNLLVAARRTLNRALARGTDEDVTSSARDFGGLTLVLTRLRAELRQIHAQQDLLMGRVPGGRRARRRRLVNAVTLPHPPGGQPNERTETRA